jgi:L-ascorbate metabolism protein UlaG (beta-lactamase superfamily)
VPPRAHRRRNTVISAFGVLLLALALFAWNTTDGLRAFGAAPSSSTLARARESSHFVDQHFENTELTRVMQPGAGLRALDHWLRGKEMRAPICALPLAGDTRGRLGLPSMSGLRVTWLGHSTTLIEIDGTTVLTDPVWSERASPSRSLGPRRFHPPPLALDELPKLDAVVISHEHYDHLDMATVRALAERGVHFHVPLGIGPHLRRWGVPARQVEEYDWWQSTVLPGGLRLTATPARHFNGRGIPGRIGSFWASWALVGPQHRVFFSGDTGLTDALTEIARREGPFDLSLFEIGQYDKAWGEIHLGPIGALAAHKLLGAKKLLPIHWATFQLGYHDWSEPAETLVREAAKLGVSVLTPLLGQPVEPTLPVRTAAWWRALPPTAARCP